MSIKELINKLENCGQDTAIGIVRKLKDVDIEVTGSRGSLLHLAAKNNWKRLAKELLDLGCDGNVYDLNDNYALNVAFIHGHWDLAILLAKNGCSFSDYNDHENQLRALVRALDSDGEVQEIDERY